MTDVGGVGLALMLVFWGLLALQVWGPFSFDRFVVQASYGDALGFPLTYMLRGIRVLLFSFGFLCALGPAGDVITHFAGPGVRGLMWFLLVGFIVFAVVLMPLFLIVCRTGRPAWCVPPQVRGLSEAEILDMARRPHGGDHLGAEPRREGHSRGTERSVAVRESSELSWRGLEGMIRQEWPIGRLECEIDSASNSVRVAAYPANGESRVVARAAMGSEGSWTLEPTWPIQNSVPLVGLGEHAACWFTLVRLLRDEELREKYGSAATTAPPEGLLADGSLALASVPEPSETGPFWTPETREDLLARTSIGFWPVFVGRVKEASHGTLAIDPSIPGDVKVFACDFWGPPHLLGSFESVAAALSDDIGGALPGSLLL